MAAGLGSGGCWAGAAVSAAAQAPTKGAEGRIGSHGAVMGAANCVKSPNALFHIFSRVRSAHGRASGCGGAN